MLTRSANAFRTSSAEQLLVKAPVLIPTPDSASVYLHLYSIRAIQRNVSGSCNGRRVGRRSGGLLHIRVSETQNRERIGPADCEQNERTTCDG